jgi:RsiW-degrading membrane proteinase PrsW (M82 family)
VRVLRRRWLQIFFSGLVLLYLVERTLLATQNLNLVPSVLLLGAFLVPVTFTTYLYERLPEWEVPLPPLAICFVWGGALGVVVAGTLEYDLLRSLGVLALLGVGLIEEGAKLIFPLIFYFLGRYRSEGTGILFGVSTAMGFAALETMGYGFVTLLKSQGNLAALDEVLLARGLMSPAGHAAWTGFHRPAGLRGARRRHEPYALGKVRSLQRPGRNRLGHSGGLARLLPVGQHQLGRALDRPDLAPPGGGAGSRRDPALVVPQSHANQEG